MDYTINQLNGRVLDVTCNYCHKLLPFTQPEVSSDVVEATILDHDCPRLTVTQKVEIEQAQQAAENPTLIDTPAPDATIPLG